jgi:hypothetical protein
VRPEGLGKLEKIHLIGTRSRDLPACSIVPQPPCHRVPPLSILKIGNSAIKLVEISHVEFQQYPWYGLWGTWKIQFMVLWKFALLWINIDENWNCPTNFGGQFLHWIPMQSVERFMEYRESPLMTGQHGSISRSHDFWRRPPTSPFNKVSAMVRETYEKAYLWSYVNLGLLRINTVEYRNCPQMVYEIMEKSMKVRAAW